MQARVTFDQLVEEINSGIRLQLYGNEMKFIKSSISEAIEKKYVIKIDQVLEMTKYLFEFLILFSIISLQHKKTIYRIDILQESHNNNKNVALGFFYYIKVTFAKKTNTSDINYYSQK